jgi:hypothetical protein
MEPSEKVVASLHLISWVVTVVWWGSYFLTGLC